LRGGKREEWETKNGDGGSLRGIGLQVQVQRRVERCWWGNY
jgi:hypothetical protein